MEITSCNIYSYREGDWEETGKSTTFCLRVVDFEMFKPSNRGEAWTFLKVWSSLISVHFSEEQLDVCFFVFFVLFFLTFVCHIYDIFIYITYIYIYICIYIVHIYIYRIYQRSGLQESLSTLWKARRVSC